MPASPSSFRARSSPVHLHGLGRTIAATSFGFVVVQLDVTIVNVALPRIGAELGAPVASLQWVVDAYTLTFAVLLLSAGVLADRLGARRVYLGGFALFALSSAACGLAGDVAQLVAARAVQGIAAAMMVPSSLTLLNHSTQHEPSLRAKAVGAWTAAGGVSIAAGPVVGALLLEWLGWRSIFAVNVPLCAIAVWWTLRHVPAMPADAGGRIAAPDVPADAWWWRLDPAGQVLAIVALTALTGGLIELHRFGPGDGRIVAAFATAISAALAFCVVESRVTTPMLPLRLFRLPTFSAAVVFGILVNLTYYGVLFALSLYLQRARGYTALQAGLCYLPLTGTFIVSNLVSGPAVARYGARRPMLVGALIAAGGYALLARLDGTTPWWAMVPAFTAIPFGMGLAVPAMTTTILSAVDRRQAGTASAVLNAARQSGGTVGVALFGALVAGDAIGIVAGLHRAASISCGLLLLAAVIVFWRIRSPAAATIAARS